MIDKLFPLTYDPTIRSNSPKGNEINATLLQENRNDSRIEVELPVKYKQQWESFGIEWTAPIEGNPFVATAKLPEGWTVRENPRADFDKQDFALLDHEGKPRVTVWIKMAFYDRSAYVNILSPEEAEKLGKKYSAESDTDKQFQQLLKNYQHVLNFTSGCGSRVQPDIDRAWGELKNFAAEHPEFEHQVPTKKTANNDGTDGMSTGLLMLANEMSKDGNNQDCIIM
jgi:hypothetical protein